MFERKQRAPSASPSPSKVVQRQRSPERRTSALIPSGSGQPLDTQTRAYFEPRFGYDLSRIRLHADEQATAATAALGTRAYTIGQDIVLGAKQHAVSGPEGRQLLAHELTHAIQQRGSTTGADSSVALTHPESAAEREASTAARALGQGESFVPVQTTGPVIAREPPTSPAPAAGMNVPSPAPPQAASPSEDEVVERAIMSLLHALYPGALTPQSTGTVTAANTKVAPHVAVHILENLSNGQPAFKPELGKAGCSWFVSEGNPHVGIDVDKNIELPVEVANSGKPLKFTSEMLVQIRDELLAKIDMADLEVKYRSHQGIAADKPLNSKARKGLARLAQQLAETRMWDEVGRRVRDSAAKVGEVILKGSEFSKSADGKFLVIAEASKVQVKGGVSAVIHALENGGITADPVLVEAAEKMAVRLKWAGRVKTAFRYGGRVLIVVAVAADVYTIYKAQDRVKATVGAAGGWGGAAAASGLFAEVFAPANAAGPVAWVAYGVGILVSGGIGYWVGSGATTLIYELVLE